MMKTLLARQGIYDKHGSVHAYELLYRNGDTPTANVDHLDDLSGEAATSSVITQLFANLDMDSILGNKPAFINFTYNHLIQQIPKLLPKNLIVVEVLETVVIDQPLISSLIALKKEGYKIALDDFIFREEASPLVEIADIIKIDVLHLNQEQIQQQLAPLEGFKGKLLAEKIEDKDQFLCCIALGFNYFQGFFLNKPDLQKGHAITESKIHLLRLLAELNDENVSLKRIEEIILQAPKFSYRILRLANSAFFSKGRKIESLMDAIVHLGLIQICNWLNLLMLSSLDDLVPDLMERTLIRAKMCESVAKILGSTNPHQAYLVGMFSTIDAMLNESMPSLLAKIQLSETLNEALLNHEGELGRILKLTLDYENGNFSLLENSPLNDEDLINAYIDAIEHANSVLGLVSK